MLLAYIRTCVWLVALLLAWELVGRFTGGGAGVFPPVSKVIGDYIAAGDLYRNHVATTAANACMGFAVGASIAIVAAVIFCFFPAIERVFQGANIALFVLPAIAIGPLLVLVLNGSWPQIVLAAIILYFPAMVATLVGLREIDSRLADTVRVYGGGEVAIMRFVRLRSAAPSIFAGLGVAWSLAVLGAILGEFGSGERWGLGTFLLTSLGQANAARLWGISFAAAAIALIGYGLFALLGGRLTGSTISATISFGRPADQGARSRTTNAFIVALSVAMPLLLWWFVLEASGLSPIIAPGPVDVFSYIFLSPTAADARLALVSAAAQTVPLAVLGLIAGLAVAFALAALSVISPTLMRGILPIAMVLQNTPSVALAPIILLLLGRGVAACLVMAILVVFFPAYVLLQQGLSLVPRAALETVQIYGGGRLAQLRLISIPFSLPYLIAAAKLVAPRALLGVMVAEWLLTGTGLGYLMDVSRGMLDYGMVWSSAVVSILISVAAYLLVSLTENLASSSRSRS
jgi:ABC-type nitrate/sulfonate/bicarbonate transport system permease component